MDSLIFVTNNAYKITEVAHMLAGRYSIQTSSDVGIYEDIPETGETFQANASQKSRFIYERLHRNCFADDSGLEVEALGGAPGVYSARYSGSRDMDKNIDLLLDNLKNEKNRKATFRTTISLIFNDEEYLFEGSVKGTIGMARKGRNGFGYDPVFIPDGFDQTFGEMEDSLKASMSHRAEAVGKLVQFLSGFSLTSDAS